MGPSSGSMCKQTDRHTDARAHTHLELAAQAVHDDLQVELAHALDHSLAGLLIAGEVEGGVLLQSVSRLALVSWWDVTSCYMDSWSRPCPLGSVLLQPVSRFGGMRQTVTWG